MAIAIFGAWFVYTYIFSPHDPHRTASVNSGGYLPWFGALLLLALAGPAFVQYAALRSAGLRTLARSKEKVHAPPYLLSWWEAQGHKFTKRQFGTVYGTPFLFWATVVVAWTVLAGKTVLLIVMLGFAFPRLAGLFWYLLKVIKQPAGTLIEVGGKGIRFHEPPPEGMLDSSL